MARLGSTLHWLRLVREIDLRHVRREVEAPMTVRLVGDPRAARRLAPLLSSPSDEASASVIHLAPEALPEAGATRTVTVLAVPAGETEPELRRQIERWRSSGQPLLMAVLDDARYAASDEEVEAGRIFLPSLPGADALARRLAPALMDVVEHENERAALGRAVPALRSAAVDRLIEDTSRANALYAATTGLAEFVPVLAVPLTAADLVVLTKNQLVMAYRIALVAGKQGRPMDVLGEMLSVVGGGLFFRQVARELVGLIPILGWLPKVAIAYAGTRVIGLTVRRWALDGRVVGVGEMAALRDEALAAGRGVAAALRERLAGDKTPPALVDAARHATEGPPVAGDPIPMPDGDGRDVFSAADGGPV
jgi:uncharacterized protein (DUF697 family)